MIMCIVLKPYDIDMNKMCIFVVYIYIYIYIHTHKHTLTGHFIGYTLLVPSWTPFCLQNCLHSKTGCWKHFSEILVHIDILIPLNRPENVVGISGSALAWFKSYLSDRHQFVTVNEEVSYRSQVQYGVPQGSVLWPLLFTLYMLPLGNIIRKHRVSFHCYADDTQLYISLWPSETHQIEKLMECIVYIKKWMTSNFSLLNSEKYRGVNYRILKPPQVIT